MYRARQSAGESKILARYEVLAHFSDCAVKAVSEVNGSGKLAASAFVEQLWGHEDSAVMFQNLLNKGKSTEKQCLKVLKNPKVYAFLMTQRVDKPFLNDFVAQIVPEIKAFVSANPENACVKLLRVD